MGIFSTFFSPPKPRRFAYTPRYYDQEREERELRKKRILQEVERQKGNVSVNQDYVPNIRGQIRAKKEEKARVIHRQNIRRVIIFFVLLYLAFLFFTR